MITGAAIIAGTLFAGMAALTGVYLASWTTNQNHQRRNNMAGFILTVFGLAIGATAITGAITTATGNWIWKWIIEVARRIIKKNYTLYLTVSIFRSTVAVSVRWGYCIFLWRDLTTALWADIVIIPHKYFMCSCHSDGVPSAGVLKPTVVCSLTIVMSTYKEKRDRQRTGTHSFTFEGIWYHAKESILLSTSFTSARG